MSSITQTSPRNMDLIYHLSADLVHAQGVGIGIVRYLQHHPIADTVRARRRLPNVKMHRFRLGLSRSRLRPEGVKSKPDAHILAVFHALADATKFLKTWQGEHPSSALPRLTIAVDNAEAPNSIRYHRERGLESLCEIVSVNQRALMMRILKKIRKLKNAGIDVSIDTFTVDPNTAMTQARRMARQRGQKSCSDRAKAFRLRSQSQDTQSASESPVQLLAYAGESEYDEQS